MAIDVFFSFCRDSLTCSNSKQPRRDAAAYFMDAVWMSERGETKAAGRRRMGGWLGGRGEVGERGGVKKAPPCRGFADACHLDSCRSARQNRTGPHRRLRTRRLDLTTAP